MTSQTALHLLPPLPANIHFPKAFDFLFCIGCLICLCITYFQLEVHLCHNQMIALESLILICLMQ